METITGMKHSVLLLCPTPLLQFKFLLALNESWAYEIAPIYAVHQASVEMHQAVADGNEKCCTRVQKLHSVKTNVLPSTFMLSDYVMIRAHKKSGNKLQPKCQGPTGIIEVKSNSVLVLEDILQSHRKTGTRNE